MRKLPISLCLILLAFHVNAQSLSNLWVQAEAALAKDQPKTALTILSDIYTNSLSQAAWGDAFAAAAKEMSLRTNRSEDTPQTIGMIDVLYGDAPAPLKPLLDTLRVRWLMTAFKQFPDAERPNDLNTPSSTNATSLSWTKEKLLQQITEKIKNLPASYQQLNAYPAHDLDLALSPGSLSDQYRPTLFDINVWQAIRFYEDNHLNLTNNISMSIANLTAQLTTSPKDFMDWAEQLPSTTPEQNIFRLLALLMRTHTADGNLQAVADADFYRIKRILFYLVNKSREEYILEDSKVEALIDQALDHFEAYWKDNELSAHALALKADRLYNRHDYLQALLTAEKAMDRFPKSSAVHDCYKTIQSVKEKRFWCDVNRIWTHTKPDNRPCGIITVGARNINKAWFRLYPLPAVSLVEEHVNNPRELQKEVTEQLLEDMLKTPPFRAWEMDIVHSNYMYTTQSLEIDEPLPFGTYRLIASTTPLTEYAAATSTNIDLKTYTVHVTDLAVDGSWISYGYRYSESHFPLQPRILNNETGLPETNAPIKITRYWDYGDRGQTTNVTTDAYGEFPWTPRREGPDVITVEKGADCYMTYIEKLPDFTTPQITERQKTLLLTDRAIYRPGQKLYFKGIYYATDAYLQRYAVRTNASYTLHLKDPNNMIIESKKVSANQYGSFSGSFTLPRNRGTGLMTLVMADEQASHVTFSVEEYKRPTFYVQFDSLPEQVRLGDIVHVKGRALNYFGAPLTQAKLKWSVRREDYYPYYASATCAESKPTCVLDSDGTFDLTFVARNPFPADAKENPHLLFTIQATVTDASGETREAKTSLRACLEPFTLSVKYDRWFLSGKTNPITITATRPDGSPLSLAGEYAVYALQQPASPKIENRDDFYDLRSPYQSNDQRELSDWPNQKLFAHSEFQTDKTGNTTFPLALPPGAYRMELVSKDATRKAITNRMNFTVFDPHATHHPVKRAHQLFVNKESIHVGETFETLWGSGYTQAYGTIEIIKDNKRIKRFASQPNETQLYVTFPITDDLQGGFLIVSKILKEGELLTTTEKIDVPWASKQLVLNWTHIRSKLEPKTTEKWSLRVKHWDGTPATSEILAAMYDASLDTFTPHKWESFSGFRYQRWYIHSQIAFPFHRWSEYFSPYSPPSRKTSLSLTYRSWFDLVDAPFSYNTPFRHVDSIDFFRSGGGGSAHGDDDTRSTFLASGAETDNASSTLSRILRNNRSETALFLAHLKTDETGGVSFSFTVPDALTRWNVMLFAHDKALRHGFITTNVVTQRPLVITPNLPRFLREGDAIELPVKVTNMDTKPQKGTASLSLKDPSSGAPLNHLFGDKLAERAFDIQPGQSQTITWPMLIPEKQAGVVQYTILAKGDDHADGEEGQLPVLARKVPIIESKAFTVRGGEAKHIEMQPLIDSQKSPTIRHLNLEVEMTPNSIWNAILALPYLTEYPLECSEQTFHRYYANTLGRLIIQQNPEIKATFEQWRASSKHLKSPLLNNQNLKSIAVEETPWVHFATTEAAWREATTTQFAMGKLASEQQLNLSKLVGMRNPSGLWPWFSGGNDSFYISCTIMNGFGRLRELGVNTIDEGFLVSMVSDMDMHYLNTIIRLEHVNGTTLTAAFTSTDALYLYARSFFLTLCPPAEDIKRFWMERISVAKSQWPTLSRLSRAQLAIALKRLGEIETAQEIMKSIRENAVQSEESGMYWKDQGTCWWWDNELDAQAMMIEAFLEITGEKPLAEACALWLVNQKRGKSWPTTISTANAIYAILQTQQGHLSTTNALSLTIAGVPVEPGEQEAGTCYFSKRFSSPEITPEHGRIDVKNNGQDLASGALHWQYMQDLSALKASEAGSPLQIKRTLYRKEQTATGIKLIPIDDSLKQGDSVLTRLEITLKQELDFIHLKDTRAASIEPLDTLSSYEQCGGQTYYRSTRDTATHFFFEHLRAGRYTIDYECRVFQNGSCNSGYATIQCMYAPEFSAHSESGALTSKANKTVQRE